MRPLNYVWAAQDKALIGALQSRATPGNLTLNFNPFIYSRICRSVSLTSANNLSAAHFTVTGLYKGQVVSKTIDGPNANTVDTSTGDAIPEEDVIFDVVTQVSVDAAVNDVSVGTGLYGHTGWFNANYFSIAINLTTTQVIVPAMGSTINYTFGATLQDVTTIPDHLLFLPDITGSLTNKTDSQFSVSQAGYVYCAVFITDAALGTDDTGSLEAIIMQQGNP